MKPRPEDVTAAYRLILGRDPEDGQRSAAIAEGFSDTAELFWDFLYSAECGPRRAEIRDRFVDAGILRRFAAPNVQGELGYIKDFLGIRTDVNFLSHLTGRSGEVEGLPIPHNFHGSLGEWVGTLRAVDAAVRGGRSEFNIMELGAGWGPWLIAGTFAARHAGIGNGHLTGVEGSKAHYEFMIKHFENNKVAPRDHDLRHGIVGTNTTTAYFPLLQNPSHEWGAAPISAGSSIIRKDKKNFEAVQCYSLTDLLKPKRRIDLLHVDIQGGELEVLSAATVELQHKVAYVVVGTHSRAIENGIFDLFSGMQWRVEVEVPCEMAQEATGKMQMILQWDGSQVWRNPKLTQNL